MKQTKVWMVAAFAGAATILTSIVMGASSGFTPKAIAANTPLARWMPMVYLPYVSKYAEQRPPLETPTRMPSDTPTEAPTSTLTETPTSLPTDTATSTPTETSTSTPTETLTSTLTRTPIHTSTKTPTSTPSRTPTRTLTQTPTGRPTRTLIPTRTKTPTRTPTKTPASTPTKTPVCLSVYPLANHSCYTDTVNYLHVVGEVSNSTDCYLRLVKITANFFDKNGQLIDTDPYSATYTYLENLPPRDTTCFHFWLPPPSSWDHYQIRRPTPYVDYRVDGRPLPNLIVVTDTASYNDTYHWYQITGQVRNGHGKRVEYIRLVGTLYNASRKVVGCDCAFVDGLHLEPNQTSSFTMTFPAVYTDVASYRIQIDGMPSADAASPDTISGEPAPARVSLPDGW